MLRRRLSPAAAARLRPGQPGPFRAHQVPPGPRQGSPGRPLGRRAARGLRAVRRGGQDQRRLPGWRRAPRVSAVRVGVVRVRRPPGPGRRFDHRRRPLPGGRPLLRAPGLAHRVPLSHFRAAGRPPAREGAQKSRYASHGGALARRRRQGLRAVRGCTENMLLEAGGADLARRCSGGVRIKCFSRCPLLSGWRGLPHGGWLQLHMGELLHVEGARHQAADRPGP
mmetsp:Transcript_92589/g.262106  ORF Transcript_92589/g.262106 Transcript_92589/m.262106 type:complete len:224 (+) Transcript_92589:144-815(+)